VILALATQDGEDGTRSDQCQTPVHVVLHPIPGRPEPITDRPGRIIGGHIVRRILGDLLTCHARNATTDHRQFRSGLHSNSEQEVGGPRNGDSGYLQGARMVRRRRHEEAGTNRPDAANIRSGAGPGARDPQGVASAIDRLAAERAGRSVWRSERVAVGGVLRPDGPRAYVPGSS
jgi:hypothetical protein